MHKEMSFVQNPNKCCLAQIVLCIAFVWLSVAGQKTDCVEPPGEPTPGNVIFDFNNISRDFINVSIFPLNTDCRIDLTKKQERFRNLCPYVNVQNFDENRRPLTITETRCCTSKNQPGFHPSDSAFHCLAERDVFGKRLLGRTCVPVFTHRLVMRRTGCSETNEYIYSKVFERVQVGCSCTYLQLKGSQSVVHGVLRPSPNI